jgi:hypothetical protein
MTPRKAPDDGSTTSIWVSRSPRRQRRKLADQVDRITQGDRRFFERFPHRQHRVRLASAAELQQHEQLEGAPLGIPPGYRVFVVIRNVFPGARMRLFLPAPEGRNTDVSEATARAIFETVATPYTWEVEADMRRLAEAQK